MKRILTAVAAVLVGGVGAVGLAATANAAETPQLPPELPMYSDSAPTDNAGAFVKGQLNVISGICNSDPLGNLPVNDVCPQIPTADQARAADAPRGR